MKVKIGDTWYSAEDQPISVMFEDEELSLIKEMDRESSPNLRFTAGRMEDADLLDWAKS
jgi:hypothetical protein